MTCIYEKFQLKNPSTWYPLPANEFFSYDIIIRLQKWSSLRRYYVALTFPSNDNVSTFLMYCVLEEDCEQYLSVQTDLQLQKTVGTDFINNNARCYCYASSYYSIRCSYSLSWSTFPTQKCLGWSKARLLIEKLSQLRLYTPISRRHREIVHKLPTSFKLQQPSHSYHLCPLNALQ